MSLKNSFNKIKREVGIKRSVIIEGNVGDVYLDDKNKIVTLKEYLMKLLEDLNYEEVIYWDRIDGVDGDLTRLDLVDDVDVSGDTYDLDDDEDDIESPKTGSGLFRDPLVNNLISVLTSPDCTPGMR